MSSNLVYPFMCYWENHNGTQSLLSAGIFSEMREREQAYDASANLREFKPEYFKLVLDDMVTDTGVNVLFHAAVYAIDTDARRVKGVSVMTNAGSMQFSADFFIDATGDGNLIALAGCDYQLGRESDGLCQPMTTCFRMSGVDLRLYAQEHAALNDLWKQAQERGEITNPRENILTMTGIGEGILHFNTTRIVKHDPTDPFAVSRAEITARKQVHEIVCFLKKNSKAFANSTLISIATEIGVRESRKLKGVHILTADELKDMTPFADSIAVGNYDIDIHNPSGTGTYIYRFKDGERFKIPYRSLVPKEYDNLLVAGRCLSATHEAQAAVRIMPICACLGQAAGTAVSVAHHTGTTVHTVDIKAVQEILKANGAEI